MNPAGFNQLPPGPPRPPTGAMVGHGNQRPQPHPPASRGLMPGLPPHQAAQRPMAPMMAPVTMPQPIPQPIPVPPPNEAIPLELRQKRLVEPSDLRSERMTEANAREALSEYVVYRLEKVNDPDEIDDEGYPAVPTWDNVIRTEVRDLSKPVITRTIRLLDDEGKSVMQKKMKLTASQQRQIEKAQNYLEAHNNDKRFCYTLQQIDTKMKKLSKDSIEYRQYMAGRESKEVTVSKTKKSKKNLLETTSLTVYFKREPRAGVNSTALLGEQRREAEHNRILEDQRRKNTQAQQLMAEQQRHDMLMRQQQEIFARSTMPPPMQPPRPHHQDNPPHPPQPKQFGGFKGTKVHVIENDPRRGGKPKVYPISSKGSRSSGSSDSTESSSDSELTLGSSVTESSDSSRHGRRRHRSESRGRNRSRNHSHGRRRYHDRPEHYGLPSRHHTKPSQHYILNRDTPWGGSMPPPLSPAPTPMTDVVDRLDDATSRSRRIAERAHGHELDDLKLFRLCRQSTLPPRVVHGHPGYRVVDSEEVVRQRHENDLSNLRRWKIRDEALYEDGEESIAAKRGAAAWNRRNLEPRFRRQSQERVATLREDLEETFEAMEAREYMNRQERGAWSPLENPFEPLGRAGRRESFAPARYN
ncbi:hypothetical protein CTA2_9050 [Colletotrichum tanaceti]|uniref:Uncharacterized protein n=1 Tax=Colletotrichum tanaceti TaxID=1306861 RepID=A0A4V6DGB7_9PEZI|nr:hypothetical protein CTA2_9050 [Colletotrichum tanaceti]TKW51876.1 hypothetical protein CTA1_1020 [Colletotrichum tanaceti]